MDFESRATARPGRLVRLEILIGGLGTADVPLVRVDIRRGTSTRARRPHAAHVPRRRPGASPTRSARRRHESSRGERWGGHLPHPYPPAHPQARVRARRGHRERRRDHHHQVRSRHRRGRQVRRRRRGTLPVAVVSVDARRGGGDGTSVAVGVEVAGDIPGMTPTSHPGTSPATSIPTATLVPDRGPLVRGLTLVRPLPSSIDPRPPPPPVPNRPRQQGERDVRRAPDRARRQAHGADDGDARLHRIRAPPPTSTPTSTLTISDIDPEYETLMALKLATKDTKYDFKAQLGVAKEFTQRAKNLMRDMRRALADSANAVDAAVANCARRDGRRLERRGGGAPRTRRRVPRVGRRARRGAGVRRAPRRGGETRSRGGQGGRSRRFRSRRRARRDVRRERNRRDVDGGARAPSRDARLGGDAARRERRTRGARRARSDGDQLARRTTPLREGVHVRGARHAQG